jgi:hypothetical protein
MQTFPWVLAVTEEIRFMMRPNTTHVAQDRAQLEFQIEHGRARR